MGFTPNSRGRSMHSILIVEDDSDIRESLAELLSDEGYDVLEAEHGARALEILKSQSEQPCVLLLDVMMPVMTGPELLDALRDQESLSSIPVIVISAAASKSVVPRATHFMRKPLDFEVLLRTVHEICPH